jgi:hypothetical protein
MMLSRKLAATPDGALWEGGRSGTGFHHIGVNGLTRFDGEMWEELLAYAEAGVSDLAEGPDGALWVSYTVDTDQMKATPTSATGSHGDPQPATDRVDLMSRAIVIDQEPVLHDATLCDSQAVASDEVHLESCGIEHGRDGRARRSRRLRVPGSTLAP